MTSVSPDLPSRHPRRGLRHALAGLLLMLVSQAVLAMSVVFLNPGKSDEKFWLSVSQFMAAAGDSLGIELEVLYAERDATRMIGNARRVVARTRRPDYLVAVNEKQVAAEILRLTMGSGIKVFLINNTLNREERSATGAPRQGMPHWIGSLVPNNEDAGYRMARQIIDAGQQRFGAGQRLPMLAICGDRGTAAGLEREAGLRRALAEQPMAELRQVVYGEWNQARAREQAAILFKRHPDTRLVWCANDLMAFGAMEAAVAAGLQPGRDVFFSGLNNSPEAMQALRDGRLTALASGHFSTGAWALVMLYDFHHGRDFAAVGPIERSEPLFVMLTPGQAERFLEWQAAARPSGLDFKAFSRVHHPELRDYRFSILPFLQ
ncbi:MAG: ABC transporter substrate-binding protein [Sulfuritalea sp.]|nr:ABC transporter substrate-binding protein [Sulfuritalea sp.]MDP1981229.1 ABC transporter substrate-binding protein [Sulfuritalea sp.]